MKRPFLIYALIAALLLLVWLFWPPTEIQNIMPEQADTSTPPKDIAKQSHEASQPEIAALARTNAPINRADPKSARAELWKREIESKNIPLDFYGKVIDQDSNSLSGVNIRVRVRHWKIDSTGGIPLDRQTDADGRFDIHGITGDAFDIESMGKNGYEREPSRQGFGAIGGNITEPVVFRMWNTNAHQHLITGDKRFHIVPDGRPYFINLINGTIAEAGEGNLKVWVKYVPSTTSEKLYDWSAKIDILNGGLLEEGDLSSAMYVAPPNGYVSSFESQQQIKSGQSGSIGTKRFFVMLNGGQTYGRITVELIAPFNYEIPGLIRISYAINSSGSEILY